MWQGGPVGIVGVGGGLRPLVWHAGLRLWSTARTLPGGSVFPLLFAAALAAPPTALPPARTVKVDVYRLEPAMHRYGSDWKRTALTQWTTVLDCKPVAARIESCTFPQGVWWGVVVQGSTEFSAENLPSPGTLEITWSPRGKLAAWDLRSGGGDFGGEAANLMLRKQFHRGDLAFKPDSKRVIGQEIEQDLVRDVAGALELELPKRKKDDEALPASWGPSSTPWLARRWRESVSSHKLGWTVAAEEEGVVRAELAGRVGERTTSTSNDESADTVVSGTAMIDPVHGRLLAGHYEVRSTTTTAPLVGHHRTVTTVVPWDAATAGEPSPLPDLRLPVEGAP